MRIAMIIVRTLLGLLFVFSSVVYFLMMFGVVPAPPLDGGMKTFNEGLAASGYFFTFLKITELVCGILLLTGRFVPLALVILAPIILNIFLVHLFIARDGVWIRIVMVLAAVFLAYCYRDAFKPLLTSRYTPAT